MVKLTEEIKGRLEERKLRLDVAFELSLILFLSRSLFLNCGDARRESLKFHSVLLVLFLTSFFFSAWRLLLEVTDSLPLQAAFSLQSFLYQVLLEHANLALCTSPLNDGQVRNNLDLTQFLDHLEDFVS